MDLIASLSKHLFWDVDIASIDTKKNSAFIINKVLKFGTIDDWLLLKGFYGIDSIVEKAVKFRDLDRKTISFLSLIADVPKDSFLCYTTKQSIPKHWNF